ncbi:MAG: imidazolonepropionase [Chloroflexi bacterium HGW-Chloroflexi-10]|nr:MAG: imidazolonepropionase [Chloroflexi bacterium HGW-Chloroflexi-10]
MLIHSASQLLTLAGGPQRGQNLGKLGIIPDGAVLIRDGLVVETGPSADLLARYPEEECCNVKGQVVLPGFVDPHTHLIFMGNRSFEFEMRLEGKSYMEIMEAGGGIVNTVRMTRSASVAELKAAALPRVQGMLKHGTTSAEAKTGYGLESRSELNQLQAILELDSEGIVELAPTYLGAHAIPPEYKDDAEGYTREVVEQMLPELDAWWEQHATGRTKPFVDVFCETGAFSLEQSRRILEKAKSLSFPLKIHADEFDNLGGAALAAELGAASADHLVRTSALDISALAQSNTVAVALPPTPFGLGHSEYTPARAILEANGLLAIASDLNPGTAWCENMQFVIALSCRYLKISVAQAIVCATINSAAAIGRADRVGSLEPGKQADLLVLSVDDYRNLGYQFGGNLVQKVMKRGVWVVE